MNDIIKNIILQYFDKCFDVTSCIKSMPYDRRKEVYEYIMLQMGNDNKILNEMNISKFLNASTSLEQFELINTIYTSFDDDGKLLLLKRLRYTDDGRILRNHMTIFLDYIKTHPDYPSDILNMHILPYVLCSGAAKIQDEQCQAVLGKVDDKRFLYTEVFEEYERLENTIKYHKYGPNAIHPFKVIRNYIDSFQSAYDKERVLSYFLFSGFKFIYDNRILYNDTYTLDIFGTAEDAVQYKIFMAFIMLDPELLSFIPKSSGKFNITKNKFFHKNYFITRYEHFKHNPNLNVLGYFDEESKNQYYDFLDNHVLMHDYDGAKPIYFKYAMKHYKNIFDKHIHDELLTNIYAFRYFLTENYANSLTTSRDKKNNGHMHVMRFLAYNDLYYKLEGEWLECAELYIVRTIRAMYHSTTQQSNPETNRRTADKLRKIKNRIFEFFMYTVCNSPRYSDDTAKIYNDETLYELITFVMSLRPELAPKVKTEYAILAV